MAGYGRHALVSATMIRAAGHRRKARRAAQPTHGLHVFCLLWLLVPCSPPSVPQYLGTRTLVRDGTRSRGQRVHREDAPRAKCPTACHDGSDGVGSHSNCPRGDTVGLGSLPTEPTVFWW